MTLYEAIFARRSVRQYDKSALDAAALSEIEDYVGAVKQLPGQTATFEIVDGTKLKGGIAPYAILAQADDSSAAFVNIGYTLQSVDLWLQSKAYGSVWCGMAKPQEPKQDYRILLGFGQTSLPLRRGEEDFKRKKLSEISDTDNAIARAVRVAPSAVNFQPWRLSFADGKVIVTANVRGVGKLLPGRLFLFDIGIALRHVEVALGQEGHAVTAFEFKGDDRDLTVELTYN